MEIPKIQTMFKCGGCGQVHSTEARAMGCCYPEEVFVCSECEEEFDDMPEATEHLESEHPEAVDSYGLPIISKAELEAVGQQRLVK